MANIINLATETKQDEIIANVVNVKETVNAVNTNVDNVNTNVNANKSTLATVNANLGTPTSGASNATGSNAHAKLNYINSMLGTINGNVNSKGVVKSVQRGSSMDGTTTISAVNVSKSVVILNSSGNVIYDSNGSVRGGGMSAVLTNSTTVSVGYSAGDGYLIKPPISWQVVEFY